MKYKETDIKENPLFMHGSACLLLKFEIIKVCLTFLYLPIDKKYTFRGE